RTSDRPETTGHHRGRRVTLALGAILALPFELQARKLVFVVIKLSDLRCRIVFCLQEEGLCQ
ncbi:MAG: hypothetical protein OXH01_07795, partial [Bacteroidetes bacterium]|nr:hypothetical protein [Bacteroidota bacterium]